MPLSLRISPGSPYNVKENGATIRDVRVCSFDRGADSASHLRDMLDTCELYSVRHSMRFRRPSAKLVLKTQRISCQVIRTENRAVHVV